MDGLFGWNFESKSTEWRHSHGFSIEDRLLGIFPGSRKGEISRMLPVFCETLKVIQQDHKHIKFVCLTLPRLKSFLVKSFKENEINVLVVDQIDDKPSMIGAMDYAIATSGTIGFELSLAKIPHIVAYKMNWFSRALAKFLVKTPYMHLTNIHLKAEVVPEFFQENCTPQKLTKVCSKLIKDEDFRKQQISSFNELLSLLRVK